MTADKQSLIDESHFRGGIFTPIEKKSICEKSLQKKSLGPFLKRVHEINGASFVKFQVTFEGELQVVSQFFLRFHLTLNLLNFLYFTVYQVGPLRDVCMYCCCCCWLCYCPFKKFVYVMFLNPVPRGSGSIVVKWFCHYILTLFPLNSILMMVAEQKYMFIWHCRCIFRFTTTTWKTPKTFYVQTVILVSWNK